MFSLTLPVSVYIIFIENGWLDELKPKVLKVFRDNETLYSTTIKI